MINKYGSEVTIVKDISQRCIIENRRKKRKMMIERVHQQYLDAKKAIDDLYRVLS
jgi:hypothetical protein